MKDICKISFDNLDSDCDGGVEPTSNKSEKMAFGFASGVNLSDQDLEIKKRMQEQILDVAKKCYLDGDCDPLDIIAIKYKKCEACQEELPALFKTVIEPLQQAGVSVLYEELDAKLDPGGKELFQKAECRGTPCILTADPNTGEYKKAYEGRQQSVGRLSMVLGIPNPIYYGDISKVKPVSMYRNEITNYRSMHKW